MGNKKNQDSSLSNDKKKFCDELIAARQYLNLDLTRVAEKSKIQVKYLEKLENGEWDFLPHAYVRTFLNTYARLIGMEVGEVLAEFDRITGVPSIPINLKPSESSEYSTPAYKPEPKPKKELEYKPSFSFDFSWIETFLNNPLSKYLTLGVLLVIVLVVVLIFVIPGNKSGVEVVEEMPFEQVMEEHKEIVESSPEDTLPVPEPIKDNSEAVDSMAVKVRIEAIDRCYIKVTADNDTMPIGQTTLAAGMVSNFSAFTNMQILAGNAGGLKIFINDTTEVEDIGVEGQVARVWINTAGVERIWRGKIPVAIDENSGSGDSTETTEE